LSFSRFFSNVASEIRSTISLPVDCGQCFLVSDYWFAGDYVASGSDDGRWFVWEK